MKSPEIIKRALPWVDPDRTITPTAIVLHWWEEPIGRGDIELLEELWEERGLASQFAVLADGTIYQLTPHANSFGRHAKCANSSAIGIEIQGMGSDDLDGNTVQFQAVIALTRFLKQKFSIQTEFKVEGLEQNETMRFYGVTSHRIVDIYCSNASGKQDVHDEYLARVVEHLEST
jgi:N-acetylmuramoyl-L-alanine amidase